VKKYAISIAVLYTFSGIQHFSIFLINYFPMLKLYQSLHYPFQLPDLPYDYAALEPHIDAQTMQIHHDKHHAGYVKKLNAALENHADLHNKTLGDLLSHPDNLPSDIRQAVINHGGGHANHSLFWQIMRPVNHHSEATTKSVPLKVDEESHSSIPSGSLSQAINAAFTDFIAFQQQFSDQAGKLFGSGWTWLTVAPDKTLSITTTANQNSPLSQGQTPILTLDVWEHAYYLKYQNRRPDYVQAWWNVVNWDQVAQLFAETSA
jgi:Fe-Mn family superoxide dismutase